MEGPSPDAAREQFARIAADPDDSVELCEAALWIAAESCAPLDVAGHLATIDSLAQRASAQIPDAEDPEARGRALVHFLHDEAGFRGNAADYYDPRNSYLNEVLERRVGIPITLSILWIGLAHRLGLDAHGVGFPGHFLAALDGGSLLVDPCHGRVVSAAECEKLLAEASGGRARFDPSLLSPTPPRQVLARVLTNLKQIHLRREAWQDALACSERILLLLPDEVFELRDRGLLLRALECFGPALRDLERFVSLMPRSEEATALAPVLADLRKRSALLN